jgi:prepilin-type N-terminal cleavage/methylation domain-containing protein
MLKSSMLTKRNTSGFTIVELLIVIVVIGILAAITVVAFNGVQNNAHNAQIKATVRSYQQGLAGYLALNNEYPSVPSQATPSADDRVCLGTGYVDRDGDTEPDCGNSNFPAIEYAPFNSDLDALVTLPVVSSVDIPTPYENSVFTGAAFIRQDDFTVNGLDNPYYLMYALFGANQDCGTNVVEQVSEAEPFPAMQPSSNRWSWSDGSTTMCVVALPNPPTL